MGGEVVLPIKFSQHQNLGNLPAELAWLACVCTSTCTHVPKSFALQRYITGLSIIEWRPL
jgi:hypothetical protein